MAMSDVAGFLGRKGERDHVGQFVLVSDSRADGSFLIHYFVSQALKDGHTVVLVSFAQAFSHYRAIATKLGVNLVKCQSSGQIIFVDCLTHFLRCQRVPGVDIEGEGEEGKEGGKDGVATPLTYTLDSDFTLRGLYQLLRDSVASTLTSKPDRPVCLVVDELSVVLSLGVEVKAAIDFSHYCQQMLCAPDGLCQGEGYMVAMVHCEAEGGELEGEELLRTHLLHRCDLSLSVEGLKTGYSREVHGEIRAEWRMAERGSRWRDAGARETGRAEAAKCAQFKVTDRTVQLFARGTSRAVL